MYEIDERVKLGKQDKVGHKASVDRPSENHQCVACVPYSEHNFEHS